MFDAADLQGAKAGPVFDGVVGRLHDELAGIAGVWHAAAGHLVSLAATALAHDLWDISGVHSPEQWLGWQCGISAGRARQIIAVARRASELPECVAALEGGAISLDHAGVIARHVPGWADEAVTELAKSATVNQLSRVVRAYAFDSAEHGADSEAAVNRHMRFGTVDENRWLMMVETSADEGAVFEHALVAFRDRLFHQRRADESTAAADESTAAAATNDREPPCDVSWIDAFGELVEHALAHDGEAREHADRTRVLFHYDVDASGHPVMCPHGQPPLPDVLRQLWTCDATGAPVIHTHGRPVNVGRAQRIVPRRLRVLLERRDGGCRVPGCTHTRWTQLHHIVHWEDGGGTDSHNLVSLCAKHHRLHHLGRLSIDGDADQTDGLTFTDPHGRRITGTSRARPPGRPLPEAARRLDIAGDTWKPPLGERIDHWCVDFGRPPPRSLEPP